MLRRQRACRLICLSLFFVVTSGEEEGKFLSVCADFSALFTLPPPHPPPPLPERLPRGVKKNILQSLGVFCLKRLKKIGMEGTFVKIVFRNSNCG